MIQFVQNYEDLSTDHGYQFKFHCDKCGNGFMTEFQTSAIGDGGVRAARGRQRLRRHLQRGRQLGVRDPARHRRQGARRGARAGRARRARSTFTSAPAAASGSARRSAGTPKRTCATAARRSSSRSSRARTRTRRPTRRASSSTRRRRGTNLVGRHRDERRRPSCARPGAAARAPRTSARRAGSPWATAASARSAAPSGTRMGCSGCGAVVPQGTHFCAQCGTRVG